MREDVTSRRTLWVALLVAMFAVLAPHSAEAARKVVIMRTAGNADGFTRKQIEYQLLELARRVDPKATQVDFSFTDAAAVSNCVGELEKCRGAVLDEFGVDELLVATAEVGADGTVTVTVQRASKGKPIQTVSLAARKEALNAEIGARVGPWYGAPKTAPAAGSGPPPPPPPTTSTRPPPPPPPAIVTKPQPLTETAPVEPAPPAPASEPPPASRESSAPTAASSDDRSRGVGRPYLAGIVGGGVLAAVGVVLWTRASSTQTEIDGAPSATAADIRHLQDLESTGRTYAMVGNVTVVAGVALAATCGYFYWRARSRASSTVAIIPTVQAHGIGVTLTIGGLP